MLFRLNDWPFILCRPLSRSACAYSILLLLHIVHIGIYAYKYVVYITYIWCVLRVATTRHKVHVGRTFDIVVVALVSHNFPLQQMLFNLLLPLGHIIMLLHSQFMMGNSPWRSFSASSCLPFPFALFTLWCTSLHTAAVHYEQINRSSLFLSISLESLLWNSSVVKCAPAVDQVLPRELRVKWTSRTDENDADSMHSTHMAWPASASSSRVLHKVRTTTLLLLFVYVFEGRFGITLSVVANWDDWVPFSQSALWIYYNNQGICSYTLLTNPSRKAQSGSRSDSGVLAESVGAQFM